eukprot:gnl/TRDRNA2_/TRDRNA2_77773_c0_seq1.p1 gnl/TRDRNA2_/TRDRNA2_77773_c0~~gnl/TRDRNA2_/TRDRNA2_77773_c0_seq1.p1  ORF type:complete len:102 (+),score=1.99 gnl/TRDRNA2_/TRDRNA2_77773_c0_seq1:215-520(+)
MRRGVRVFIWLARGKPWTPPFCMHVYMVHFTTKFRKLSLGYICNICAVVVLASPLSVRLALASDLDLLCAPSPRDSSQEIIRDSSRVPCSQLCSQLSCNFP